MPSIAIWQSGGGKNGDLVPGISGGTSHVDTDLIIDTALTARLFGFDQLQEDPDMTTEFLFRFRGYDNVHAYPSLAPVFSDLLRDSTTDKDGNMVPSPYHGKPFVVAETVHAQTVKAVNVRNGLGGGDWVRNTEPLDGGQRASAQAAGLPV